MAEVSRCFVMSKSTISENDTYRACVDKVQRCLSEHASLADICNFQDSFDEHWDLLTTEEETLNRFSLVGVLVSYELDVITGSMYWRMDGYET